MVDPDLERELNDIRHPSDQEIEAEQRRNSGERWWNAWFLLIALGLIIVTAGIII